MYPLLAAISKSNNILIDNAEDLGIVMPMYNLLAYSKNYSKTSGSSWNYYRDEPNSSMVGDINYSIRNSKTFDYKTSVTERLEGTDTEKSVEIVVTLKYLSNLMENITHNINQLWSIFDFNMVYKLCNRNKEDKKAEPDADLAVAEINAPTNAEFSITYTTLYLPVVTLSIEDDKKLLQKLKTGFKRTVKWNKHRSDMPNQIKNSNLNYLIDPTFRKACSIICSII